MSPPVETALDVRVGAARSGNTKMRTGQLESAEG
ncbi:unnamed protein product, partial [marine sediment metagenome]